MWRIGALALHIGRRGAALIFFALLDLLYAASLANPPAEAKLSPTLAFIRDVLPLGVWAGMWAGVGFTCLAGAFMRRDRWAFSAAMALKVLWGSTFLAGWLAHQVERGWVTAVIWLAMAAWIAIIASWPEPSR